MSLRRCLRLWNKLRSSPTVHRRFIWANYPLNIAPVFALSSQPEAVKRPKVFRRKLHKNPLPYCSIQNLNRTASAMTTVINLVCWYREPYFSCELFFFLLPDEGEEGVNINENNDAQKDELSTGSASPSSSNSLDVPEVQTTTTSSLIKSKATIPRSKDARNRLAAHSLLLSRQQSNDSPHDDLEQNIPVTLIDHETGLKR